MPDPYLSEIRYLGGGNVDFVEVAVDAGTDVSNIQVVIYNPNGTIRSTSSLGTLDNTEAGRDIYIIDRATDANFTGLNKNGAVALAVDGTVVSFSSFDQVVTATEGPADGTDSTQIGTTGSGESLETSDFGTSYDVQTSPTPGNIPCFLAGTLILTAKGERPVETLVAGDLIWTADDGFQPILWAGKRALRPAEQQVDTTFPIRIPRDALAPGTPESDLLVSPNHRIALGHALCELYFQTHEVLVAAKHICGHRGIGPTPVLTPVVYHHLLLQRHQLICSNGAASESFHPAQVGLDSFSASAKATISKAVRATEIYGSTARPVLKSTEAALLMTTLPAESLAAALSDDLQHAA